MKHLVPEYNFVGWCLVNQASIYRLLTGGGQLKHPSCDPIDFGIAPTQVVLDFLTSCSPCIIPAPSPSTQNGPLSTAEVVSPMSTSVTLTRNLSLTAWNSACSHPSVKCGTTLVATALASVAMYLHQYRPNPAEFLTPVRYCPREARSHMAKMANHHSPVIDSMVSATWKNFMQSPLYQWTSLGTLVNCPVILPIQPKQQQQKKKLWRYPTSDTRYVACLVYVDHSHYLHTWVSNGLSALKGQMSCGSYIP